MKKDSAKKKNTMFKPRAQKRQCLAEIAFNSSELRRPLKKRVSSTDVFEFLPNALLIHIFTYLEPSELVKNCQLVSKYWQIVANTPILWKKETISLRWQVRCSKCLVERRSKGKVYMGSLRSSLKPVTLRKIYLDITNAGYDDGVPTSILREVSFLRELSHSSIASIVSAEVSGKIIYICTEQGDFNLKDYLKKIASGTSISKSTVQALMKQLFCGLEYIHKRGVIHRNLKPDNILVSADGSLKLSDFTLSRMETVPRGAYTPEDPKERERSGREARRLWYRAPELLLRKDLYGSEVDIWTAGCLLAEIVLGNPLFSGENEIEHLFKIFRLTGVPSSVYAKSFPNWEKVSFCDVLKHKESRSYRSLVSKLIPSRELELMVLHKLGNVIGEEGLDLLQKCLDTDPSSRITAAQALSHPFLASAPAPETCLEPMLLLKNELLPSSDYLSRQENINESMRSILVDWLIDVSIHFEVQDETLHLAISYIDRALSLFKVDRTKLQLVGVTCMKIADVFNERSKEYYRQENSIEYAYITADEYTPAQVVAMEKEILSLLGFRLLSPNILYFLKRYELQGSFTPEACQIASYLSDLMLLSYSSLKFKPSLLASAVLFVACAATEYPETTPQLLLKTNSEVFGRATEHVRTIWLDSRTNPQISRFDSINLKHHSINPRGIWPPALERKFWI